jgi:CDP-diacylglycerol--glycerol-3-phosphate 3-phosphatidyltransferase
MQPAMSDSVRKNLPNTITLLRLVFAAAFFGSLNAYRYPDENIGWARLAVVFFLAAACTDALDGYLARKWQVISRFGRIMDPFCDKVLILGAFVYLAGPRFVVPELVEERQSLTMATGVYPWMVVVILARELLVTSIRGVVEASGSGFMTQAAGKAKMILQSICIPIVLVLVIEFLPGENDWARWLCYALIYLTIIVTVWSGLPYLGELRRMMMPTPHPDADGEPR